MVVGFNHNVMYKGEVFHIQTEDSGINNPHIITLLYRGGIILSSRKTSYADIIKMENLDSVVEELMKEQHKGMLRSLKAGDFDERAFGRRSAASPARDDPAVKTTAEKQNPSTKTAAAAPAGDTPVHPAAVLPPVSPPSPPNAHREGARPPQSLDEVILDYLVRSEE